MTQHSLIKHAPYGLVFIFSVSLALLFYFVASYQTATKAHYIKTNQLLSEVWMLRLEFDSFEKLIVSYEQFPSQDRFNNMTAQYRMLKEGVDGLIERKTLFRVEAQDKILALKTSSDYLSTVLKPESSFTAFRMDRMFKKSVQDLNDNKRSLVFFIVENGDFLERPGDKQFYLLMSNICAIVSSLCFFLMCLILFGRNVKILSMRDDIAKTKEIIETQQSAMAASADGVGIVDEQGKLVYANSSLTNICGLYQRNFSNFLNHDWEDIFEDDVQIFIKENIYPELSKSSSYSAPLELHGQGNEVLNTQLTLTRLMGGGLVVTLRDITEQVRTEGENKKLQNQFYQSQKMEAIGRLAGGIAHDFNNILAAISGNAEFLHEDLEEQPKIQKYSANILNATSQAKTLVDQMLAFSRRKQSDTEAINLSVPLHEILAMLSATLPKKVELEQDITKDRIFIDANSTQISQVVMNLCVNAKDSMNNRGVLSVSLKRVKSTEMDQPDLMRDELPVEGDSPLMSIEDISSTHVRLSLGTLKRKQDYAVLTVRDNGTGMSKTIMEHIFDPFFTTKPVDKGTGLGLSTVHGVIASHRAAMVVDSVIGEGTSFELYFPLVEDVAGQKDEAFYDPEADDDFIPAHILLVEDQDDVRLMTESMIERLGYEVTSCAMGIEALEFLKENHDDIDLIITDQNMPKMNGLELIMQTSYDYPEIPVILLSGYSLQKMQDMIQDQPTVKGVLRKPVSKKAFGSKISMVLKEVTAEDDQEAA